MNLSGKIEQELRDIDLKIEKLKATTRAEIDLLQKRKDLLKTAQKYATGELDRLLDQLGVNI